MKRVLLGGGIALVVLFASVQQAPAWVNFKFGVGIDFSFHCGGKCHRPHHGGGAHDGHFGWYPSFYLGGGHHGGHAAGYSAPQDYSAYQHGGTSTPAPTPQPAQHPQPAAQNSIYYPTSWYGQTGYQPASYNYSPYAYPGEFSYGLYYAPSYWGR